MSAKNATSEGAAGLRQREANQSPDPGIALMEAFAGGDEEAFVRLYERYRDRMLSYTRRLLGEESRAEEATQDIFLKLYRAKDRYHASARFSTLLYRIATNHCLNLRARHEHKHRDRDAVAEEHAVVQPEQAVGVARQQLQRSLQTALSVLPQNQRAALLLCHYEGMSYAEAAEALGASVSAVKSLIHRARERMMKELAPELAGVELNHG